MDREASPNGRYAESDTIARLARNAAARIAGAMTDRARSSGHTPGFPDVAIAATASAHHLTILTGNVRHYQPLGVRAKDPFTELP